MYIWRWWINKWYLSRIDQTIHTGQRRYIMYCTIWVLGTGNRDLLRPASALCWGRPTGIISEIWYLPVSGPTAGRDSPRLVKSLFLLIVFPRLLLHGRKTNIILRHVKKTRTWKLRKKYEPWTSPWEYDSPKTEVPLEPLIMHFLGLWLQIFRHQMSHSL